MSVVPIVPPPVAGEAVVADHTVPRAVLRGALGRCPACGEGRLFGRFLKVAEDCGACGQHFGHHRADDFPPYLVMFAVGHIVGYGIYVAETRFDDVPLWLHVALWPTLAIVLSLALLQPVKGAVVGLQYGLGMHGFGAPVAREEERVEPGAWGGSEGLVRERPARAELAESPAEGRRDPDAGRPRG